MRSIFFNDTATTEIYTLSLHDALPISAGYTDFHETFAQERRAALTHGLTMTFVLLLDVVSLWIRSEEHTSELQSQPKLECRLVIGMICAQVAAEREAVVPRQHEVDFF